MAYERNVHIFGRGGRIGSSLEKRLHDNGVAVSDTPELADTLMLCTPSDIGKLLLDEMRSDSQLIIDFSGASKRLNQGSYGLIDQHGTLWTPPNPSETLFGNPGCIASAVLRSLDDSGLRKHLSGDLQITACGGRSYAPKFSEESSLKAGNRTIQHPHVAEIEKALSSEGVFVTHFSTSISSVIEHGLLVTVSGKLLPNAPFPEESGTVVSVDDVLGTDKLMYRYQTYEKHGSKYFSLQAVIDNVEFVTANAVKLLHHLDND